MMSPFFSSLNLIFLGPPGSGKHMQAEILARSYNLAHISSRELLREEIRKNSYVGREARPSMEIAIPVADNLMAGLVLSRLDQEDCARGFLLTGFPRNARQAMTLDDILAELGRVIERVICIDVPDSVLARRLNKAGDTAATEALSTQNETMTPEMIQERISSYRQSVGPLIDLYRARGQLLVIDGDCPEEMVTERVQQAIGMPVGV
jgi:adenylate kinase